MNCTHVRALLPCFVYGDLPPDQSPRVDEHLAGCPACRREQLALAQVRGLLDAVPAPAVAVDLPRLYRQAALRQVRRSRRWRSLAGATLAVAAAVVLAVLLSRLEVRLGRDQIVVRWGATPIEQHADIPPAPQPPPPAPLPLVQAAPPAAPDLEPQVRLLSELVQTLSADADQRDDRRQRELALLREQLQSVQQQMTQLRMATEKDVSALYAAQFPEK